MYETGSGRVSIGRDVREMRVLEAPAELDCLWRAGHGTGRNCVAVSYLGPAYCVRCLLPGRALGLSRSLPAVEPGSHTCGSIINHHQDRGGGGNCQLADVNTTFNVGHTRHLSFRLGDKDGAQVASFELRAGSINVLAAADEDLHPRDYGGTVHQSSFFHGMTNELEGHEISTGYVVRSIAKAKEVDMATNYCILSQSEVLDLSEEPPNRYGVPTHMGPRLGASRDEFFDTARDLWRTHAKQWAELIQPLFEQAMASPEWSL